jgi:hypothetical protein
MIAASAITAESDPTSQPLRQISPALGSSGFEKETRPGFMALTFPLLGKLAGCQQNVRAERRESHPEGKLDAVHGWLEARGVLKSFQALEPPANQDRIGQHRQHEYSRHGDHRPE